MISDSFMLINQNAETVVLILLIFNSLLLLSHLITIFEIKTQKRKLEKEGKKVVLEYALLSIIIFYFGFCIYVSDDTFSNHSLWNSAQDQLGMIHVAVEFVIFLFLLLSYTILVFSYPKNKDKNYGAIVILSTLNGLSSSLIILLINGTFNTELQYSKVFLLYFILSVVFLVFTQKLLQEKLIRTSNNLIYEKRIVIINKVMNSSYEKMEDIGSSKIYSTLNDDTEAISRLPEIIVGAFSSLLTIIFCLAYLGTVNMFGFLGSLAIILLNLAVSVIINKQASKYWIKNREMKDKHFGFITDMLQGYKELIFGKRKKEEFSSDMINCSRESKNYNITASTKILHFGLYNTLMYNAVFAVVVFVFPVLLSQISVGQLRETLFIVFYMIGPFQVLINALSQIQALKINIRRINGLIEELQTKKLQDRDNKLSNENQFIKYEHQNKIELKLCDVQYFVLNGSKNETREFTLGPINLSFHSGEIVFLIGGNGSGKSTLAKVITGLYTAHHGEILLNGQEITPVQLNEYFSAIFCEFHLFKKLYGINYKEQEKSINDLLDLMNIRDKIFISDSGEINSEELSTGQKKRLAYIVSYLQDKPILLFDEWAAEQDPEFKKFFYEELLLALKRQGKAIIVITHDDQYFHVADKVVKMNRGQVENLSLQIT